MIYYAQRKSTFNGESQAINNRYGDEGMRNGLTNLWR